MRMLASFFCVIGILLFPSCSATRGSRPSITQVRVASNNIHDIVIASNGTLWFTHGCLGMTRMTVNGGTTTFRLPPIRREEKGGNPHPLLPIGCTTNSSGIGAIAIGRNDSLWFTDDAEAVIGRMTDRGNVRYFPLPHGWAAQRIVRGPGGDFWFTQMHGNAIGRISPTGIISEYRLNGKASQPYDIVVGPDGALWFTERGDGKIGRLTTGGALTEYSIPTPDSTPLSIAAGRNKTLWFTEVAKQEIGRITTDGAITEYHLRNVGPGPDFITAASNGTLWFTEEGSRKIGSITASGSITEYDVPSFPSPLAGHDNDGTVRISAPVQPHPYIIVRGRAGTMWFTEPGSYFIGNVTIP